MRYAHAISAVVLLLTSFGCARPGNGTPVKSGTASSPEGLTFSEVLVRKEKQIWEVQKRQDVDALKQMLPDGAYIVEDDDGLVVTKEQFIDALPKLVVRDYEMKDATVIPINSTAGIVRYKVRVSGSFGGTAFIPHWSTVSSVWVNQGGVWKNMSYQETRIK